MEDNELRILLVGGCKLDVSPIIHQLITAKGLGRERYHIMLETRCGTSESDPQYKRYQTTGSNNTNTVVYHLAGATYHNSTQGDLLTLMVQGMQPNQRVPIKSDEKLRSTLPRLKTDRANSIHFILWVVNADIAVTSPNERGPWRWKDVPSGYRSAYSRTFHNLHVNSHIGCPCQLIYLAKKGVVTPTPQQLLHEAFPFVPSSSKWLISDGGDQDTSNMDNILTVLLGYIKGCISFYHLQRRHAVAG